MSKQKNNDSEAEQSATEKSSIRILTTGKVTVGRIVYATGSNIMVTQEQAAILQTMGKAKILGV